jgi:3-oxoacyl-[acyl-carrier protein] reductase
MGQSDRRVAVVTGAGRGIGAAIATRLAEDGLNVVVNDVDGASAREIAGRLEVHGAEYPTVAATVADPSGAAAIIEVARRRFGRLDVVVNNAGITNDAMLHRMTDEQWQGVLDVNLSGAFHLCRAAFPLLRESGALRHGGHGKLVNITSINGIYGTAANANYSASKAGLIGLTKALAREWGRYRVNVNAIAPGYIEGTRLTAQRGEGDTMGIPAEIRDRIVAQIPIGRPGRPEDVAALVSFLVSDDADYLTGQVIELHGGLEIINVVDREGGR